jgi:hypothetical protein
MRNVLIELKRVPFTLFSSKKEPTYSKMMMLLEKLVHFFELKMVECTLIVTHLHL